MFFPSTKENKKKQESIFPAVNGPVRPSGHATILPCNYTRCHEPHARSPITWYRVSLECCIVRLYNSWAETFRQSRKLMIYWTTHISWLWTPPCENQFLVLFCPCERNYFFLRPTSTSWEITRLRLHTAFARSFVSGKLYSLIFLAFCNLTSLLCFLLSTLHVFHSTVWVQDFLIAILIILCHVKYLVARTHTTALTFNVKAGRRFCVRLFPHFKRQPQ